MATQRVYFEKGSRLFRRGGRAASGAPWGTWALLVDPTMQIPTTPDDVFHRTVFVPAWKNLRSEGSTLPEKTIVPIKKKLPPVEPGVQHMLDLFSGTGSVGDVFKSEGFVVTSVDIDPKMSPDIVLDILSWDYTPPLN